MENEYLKDRWYVVPENTDEKAYVDFVRAFLKRQKKPDGTITHYTIFPTTDCNARCFYCFELGRSRIPMSHETALKVVQYIKNHCGGKPVKLSWFGGEPLYNKDVIDTICDGLRQEGVEFKSGAVSNGYLFDEATVKKAVESWNLKKVQISLDGTETTYNKIKAFIYKGTNPYQTVMENISHLLDASVRVAIRLNMDLANAPDLMDLVDELIRRFGGRDNLKVYAHHLFKGSEALATSYSEEEWVLREETMIRMEKKIADGGMGVTRNVVKHLKTHQCMADSGRSITILPDGNIGVCEHYSESEFIGHIDREGFDQEMLASWREVSPRIPECADCPDYPDCIMLRKCANQSVCFLQYRQGRARRKQQQMLGAYKRWKEQNTDEYVEDEIC